MSSDIDNGNAERYDAAIEHLPLEDYGLHDLDARSEEELRLALQNVTSALRTRIRVQEELDRIMTRINAGFTLDEILDNLYDDFHELIPYNRIGVALLEDDGQLVRARWTRSDRPTRLDENYAALMAGSSLEQIIETGQPRILNDLEAYLREKLHSKSTRLMVAEGMRSSLTCPLIAGGEPIGFLFFSSVMTYGYERVHINLFQQIAAQLSSVIEKGRLTTTLTEQKTAIERQNSELQQLNELKNTFLGMVAHDLRSPLGVIEMAADMLVDTSVNLSAEEQHAILATIVEQSRHMLNLIESLLDVTLIESGKLELLPQSIPLKRFLSKILDHHARLAAPKGSEIRLEAALDETHTVNADPLRLRQVLDNLLSNAVKYSPARSTIWLFVERQPGIWCFRVQDEGPGIQPDERERLFRAFERLSARPTGGERSTGLGLAIARRVVEAHGGEIGVDSEPGHGATFWFTLPDMNT
ncbi:MAG: GAF domain-containing protein [Chloroflexi bacterium]|nr:MAG: GAF domain-containing protein [Chloroflexota bacterium]